MKVSYHPSRSLWLHDESQAFYNLDSGEFHDTNAAGGMILEDEGEKFISPAELVEILKSHGRSVEHLLSKLGGLK